MEGGRTIFPPSPKKPIKHYYPTCFFLVSPRLLSIPAPPLLLAGVLLDRQPPDSLLPVWCTYKEASGTWRRRSACGAHWRCGGWGWGCGPVGLPGFSVADRGGAGVGLPSRSSLWRGGYYCRRDGAPLVSGPLTPTRGVSNTHTENIASFFLEGVSAAWNYSGLFLSKQEFLTDWIYHSNQR